jgi:anti-sigma factor RsiW
MSLNDHERARQLATAARIEGVAGSERAWLDNHLAACGDCAKEAGALDAAIGSLRTLSFKAGAQVVNRTRLEVRRRIEEREAEAPRTVLWIAMVVSAGWMALTAPYVWRGLAWFGRAAGLPDPVWQASFLMWWFLPATLLGAVAVWRSRTAEIQWGHQ